MPSNPINFRQSVTKSFFFQGTELDENGTAEKATRQQRGAAWPDSVDIHYRAEASDIEGLYPVLSPGGCHKSKLMRVLFKLPLPPLSSGNVTVFFLPYMAHTGKGSLRFHKKRGR